MCGIAGFSLSPNANVNSKRLARSLLLDIEYRGTDATGFAYLDSTGAFQVHKTDITASEFVKRRLCLPRKARTAIMHTRFATQGDPIWNDNNHPIATGTVVGVHNGHISNDDELFKTIETLMGVTDIRIATVDSEAAFAALGWTGEPVTSVLEGLEGHAALAWLDMQSEDPDTLHLARVSSSPLYVGETLDGSVIFASTEFAVKKACQSVGLVLTKLRDIEEGVYLQVLNGDIFDVKSFKVPTSRWYTSARRSGYHSALDEYEWDTPTRGMGRPIIVSTMGTTLDARLAAEEPDTDMTFQWDDGTGLSDEDRYDEWLEANAKELDERIARDKPEALADDARFESFVAQPWLHGGYLSDPELPVPAPDTTAMYLSDNKHVLREQSIEEWGGRLSCTTEAARTNACLTLKAGVRPGDAITVELNGCKVEGHIHSVPGSFPDGWYHLRVMVYNEKRPGNYEAAFIARRHYEFQLHHSSDAPRAVTNTGGSIVGQRELTA